MNEQNPSNVWTKSSRYLAFILVLGGFIWILVAARIMLGPLVIAALLAYILNPAVNILKRRSKLSHKSAVPIVFLLFLGAAILILANFVPIVLQQADNLSTRLDTLRPQLDEVFLEPVNLLGVELPIGDYLDEIEQSTSNFFQADRLFRIINSASTNLAWLFLILITTYYLLADWEKLREWLIHLAPDQVQPDVRRLHAEIKEIWRTYLRSQILIMFLLGVLSGLGAALIGLPQAVLLGFLAGILALIPSLGPAVTLVIAVIIAWFEGSTYLPISNGWFVLLTILVFNGIQIFEGGWLTPQVMGRRMQLHPGVVFVIVVGALSLGSALLALISVPFVGSASVVGRYIRARIYGIPPWEETPVEDLPEPEISP